jgi:di/tricarboxylate transporter
LRVVTHSNPRLDLLPSRCAFDSNIAKSALLVLLICRLFPDIIAPVTTSELAGTRTPMSARERRLSVVLTATLCFWVTEELHGIAPAWVGLAAAVVCLLPGLGMLPPDAFNSINHRTLLYVAALLGVVTVISETGLGAAFAKLVLASLPLRAGADTWNFGLLVGPLGGLSQMRLELRASQHRYRTLPDY